MWLPFGLHVAPLVSHLAPFGLHWGTLGAPSGSLWGSIWMTLGCPWPKRSKSQKRSKKVSWSTPPGEPKILQKSMLKPRGSKGRPKDIKTRGKDTYKVRICDACAVQMTSHGKHNFPQKLQISSKLSPFWLPFWIPFWIQKKHEKKGTQGNREIWSLTPWLPLLRLKRQEPRRTARALSTLHRCLAARWRI